MAYSYTEEIVDVQVADATQPLSTVSFELPLIVATHNVFGTRTQRYTSLAAISSAGFASDSAVYTQAALIFAQVNTPTSVLVGRRAMTSATVAFTVANNTVYTVTLRSGTSFKTFSFTSDGSALASEIATGLAALIAADTTWNKIVTVTTPANALVLTPISGKYFDVSVSDTASVVFNTVEDMSDTFAAIVAENDNWYWVTTDSHTDTDITDVAQYIESVDKIYMFSSQATAIRDKTPGNILETLQALGYENTVFVKWSDDADTTYPEAAAVGVLAGRNIDANGTDTLNGKTLAGVATDALTITQKDNIVSQGGNIYDAFRSSGFYREGRTVGGKYVDLVVFKHWLKARIKESVGSLLKRRSSVGDAIHFDTSGIAAVRQAIFNNPINVGIRNGSISNETPVKSDGTILDWRPKVTVPSVADITEDDLANRFLNDIQVEVIYTSFIHTCKITANVLLRRD